MSNPIVDVDIAVNCKTIFDFHRCTLCYKAGGSRMRYTCGHTACIECASSQECMFCISNLQSQVPVLDKVLSEQVKNATNLLNAYQNLFPVDVCRKQRLSEKLKIEKELFPECIQAPSKYYNKRKSLNDSLKTKENQLLFPGQGISSFQTNMKNKLNLVNKWLTDNQNVIQRKPFANLNTNQQILRTRNQNVLLKKPIDQYNTRKSENRLLSKERKRKRPIKQSKANLKSKNNIFTVNKVPTVDSVKTKDITDVNNDVKCIVIEESQDIFTDKDKEACLRVLEADKEEKKQSNNEESKEMLQIKTPIQSSKEILYKVPFYRKGSLFDECSFCKEKVCQTITSPNNQDVSVVIDNKYFTATITVTKCVKSPNNGEKNIVKHSVEVQNDSGFQEDSITSEIGKNTHANGNKVLVSNVVDNDNNHVNPHFKDLFSEEQIIKQDDSYLGTTMKTNYSYGKNSLHAHMLSNKKENIIIEESDSDDSSIKVQSMEIKADIHRSCSDFDYGVLSEVVNKEEHARRARRPARGMTPDSSNSSEKENFHPNKPKRIKLDKKNYKKLSEHSRV